jgi:hypothetical protein
VVRRIRADVGSNDILGQIAVGGGKVPAVLRDDAFERLGLAKLRNLRPAKAGIAVFAGLVHERELHHAVRARVGERIAIRTA